MSTASQAVIHFQLWCRGVLSWKLHLGQKKIEEAFRKTVGKLFVLDCSRQFGKTTWIAKIAIEKALQKKKAKVRVGAAFLTDLEQFVIPAFEFILEDCPNHLRPKWNAQKYTYKFPNGSEIRLVGLDRKPNGLRGNKLDLIILDEAGFISNLKHLYQFVLVPSTTHVPDAKIIMASTQPDSPDHDFNYFSDFAMDPTNDAGYICLDVYQNPLLSIEQIDRLAEEVGGKTSIAFEREYLCKRKVDSERAIVPEFSKVFIVERKVTELDQFYHRYLWMDIGVQKDLTVILFGFYDFKGTYFYLEDEVVIRGPKVTTKLIAQEIAKKIEERPSYRVTYRKIADNSHPLLLNDLTSDHQISFTATDKEKLHEMVNELRIFTGAGRLLVHPRCVHFIGAMLAGIWDKNRKQFAHSPIYGHYDALAAAVYGIRNLDTNSNPIPLHYGIDLSNTWISPLKPQKRLSETAKTLKEAFAPAKKTR
jgi:hypothetical protein